MVAGEFAGDVERALSTLGPPLQRVQSADRAVAASGGAAIAAVLVAPLESRPLARAVAMLRGARGPEWPIFEVVPDHTPDVQIRQLYGRGATMVFEWPREASLLPRLIIEILELQPRPSRSTEEDRALEKALRARCRLVPGVTRRIGLRARGGTVVLTGEVEALWQKKRIERSLAGAPGVMRLVSHGLGVASSNRTDREIARDIRVLLRGVTSVEEQTLNPSVHDGHAILVGVVVSNDERQRLRELVGNVRGVRSIEDRTTVAAAKKRRDRVTARHLQNAITTVATSPDVGVAVVRGTAVLTGQVERLETKRALEAIALQHDAIAKVANKLEVSPKPRNAN